MVEMMGTCDPAIRMAGAASGEPSWLELSRVATDKDIVNGWLPVSPAYGRPKWIIRNYVFP